MKSMPLRTAISLFLCCFAALAAKKPVTLEAIAGQRPSSAPKAIWSPAGKEFLYQQDGKLFLYDAASKKTKEIVELKKLEAAAVKPPAAKRFDWQNRRVSEQAIQWMPSTHDALVSVEGDLFLVNLANRKWEQLTATPVAERDVSCHQEPQEPNAQYTGAGHCPRRCGLGPSPGSSACQTRPGERE